MNVSILKYSLRSITNLSLRTCNKNGFRPLIQYDDILKVTSIINKFCASRAVHSSRYIQNVPSSENELVVTRKGVKKATISKAMKAYLERTKEHEEFIAKETTKYEIGRRHLANMMGEDPETFTQEDIDRSITYLFPSGLFEPRARPAMKHPKELFPKQKEAEFDSSGRPFHCLFYTGRPAYYSLIQEISKKADNLDRLQNKLSTVPSQEMDVSFEGSKWIPKSAFEKILIEPIPDDLFEHLRNSLERLKCHPLSGHEKNFLMKFREEIATNITMEDIPPLMYTEKGVPYMTAKGTRRMATAEVSVFGQGSGKVSVNGSDILYFEEVQDRQQVLFPLQLSGLLNTVDVEAVVDGGGPSGQAGAMRYGISMALRSFLDLKTIEKMRVAGLLTRDARKKERKKPGRRRARAKFTWKKR